MAKKKNIRLSISTTHIILLSFLVVILAGTLLLMLPISSASGSATAFEDALFTSTTATCVTGLVVVPTVSYWSTFGHAVLLVLIQVGGLGTVTIMSALTQFLRRRMSIADRLLVQDAFNLNTLSGLGRFVKRVIVGTLLVEGAGALLYMIVFVPEFGLRGIWIAVFNAVSAFCNAGIDIIAEDSLCRYVGHPLINFVTCGLIILGGLGYIVWWDVVRVCRNPTGSRQRRWSMLSLHSKIALTSTLVLIAAGAVITFVFEYNNPLTMKDLSLFDKIQASVFQSVTTRTAGFFTIPQENLTNGASFFSILLMFIGGSPVGTAGGIKTVTIAVLMAYSVATIKNRDNVTLFQRDLSQQAIRKAVAACCTSFAIMFLSTLLLSAATDASSLDILYETVSATATVGLTRNLTGSLNLWGKLIITGTMYLGRVGPISLAIALNVKKNNPNIIKNPTEVISVG